MAEDRFAFLKILLLLYLNGSSATMKLVSIMWNACIAGQCKLLTDGVRIASSNTIEALMEDDFKLTVNDNVYLVNTPRQERLTKVRLLML